MTTDRGQTARDLTSWPGDTLRAIEGNEDLFVSPLRDDGSTYGTPTRTWALVVDGSVFVRAANGQESKWYQAAMRQRAGRIRVAGTDHEVTFEPADESLAGAIDAAYEAKYPGSSAVPTMQGDGPKSATVRITTRQTS